MLFKSFCTLATLLFCLNTYAGTDPLVVPSSLKSVTIYRSGAEMTHTASMQLSQGSHELVVEAISNQVDINSVQVNCPATVTIMGVEYSNNYLINPEISSRIRFLQDSAARVQKDLDRVQVQIQTTQDVLDVLKANRDIKGQQTGLTVSELIKLVEYYKTKSSELQNELADQKEKQKKLNEILARIRNQIREEESKNTRTTGQIKLQLSVAQSGKFDFTISYLTPNAWWTPYYDIRVDDVKSPLKIIYKAKLVQTTGIDWKKVKLSLSTSMPSQWGNAPILNTWFLSYINPIVYMEKRLNAANRIQSMDEVLVGKAAGISIEGYEKRDLKIRGTNEYKESNAPLYIVNGAEMSAEDFSRISQDAIKSVNVLKGAQATSLYGSRGGNGIILVTLKDGLEDYVSVTDNELNLTFDIELPYDVPTNGKEQTATLKEFETPAVYKYYAVPRLDKDAYLLAEVSEWEKLNLLPGNANIIFEGTYVGKTFIDPASTSDTLNLTLGRDKRMVVKKEKLMDFSSVKFLGGNKIQKITYELTVKNNKKDAIKMLLKDQYPISSNKEIEVELLEDGAAMVNKETGVLTWKLELAPGEVKKVRFAYSVKYPKERQINLN